MAVFYVNTLHNKYLNGLSALKEDDFTRLIILPLFEAMGYERVEFNGGSYERGRDLIATITIPPKKNKHIVYIQSKKLSSNNTLESGKFGQLCHQLNQAIAKGFVTLEGNKIYPNEVYVATPQSITQRFIEEIEGAIYNRSMNVTPLDGPEIIELIKEHKISLLDILVPFEEKLKQKPSTIEGNRDLLCALSSKRRQINIESFYSDLSFYVGSINSNVLLYKDISISTDHIKVDEKKFNVLKENREKILEICGLDIFTDPIDVIESNYNIDQDRFHSESNKKNQELLNLSELKLSNNISMFITLLEELLTMLNKERFNNNSQYDTDEIERISYAIIIVLENKIDHFELLNKYIEKGISRIELKLLSKIINELNAIYEEIVMLNETISYLKSNIIYDVKYKVYIRHVDIVDYLNKETKKYRESVNLINLKNKNLLEIKNFLDETEKVLKILSLIIGDDSLTRDCFKFENTKEKNLGLSISPLDVFLTGKDIAIFGGAGVGKTTTLEAYARAISDNYIDKLCVFIPLNRVINKLNSVNELNKATQGQNLVDIMYKIILTCRGIATDSDYINKLKNNIGGNFILILDGVDEIYNQYPLIFKAIEEFKKKHPSCQLIISSRDSVSYLKYIDFLGVTLLPFTKEQLNKFIVGWFDNEKKSRSIIGKVERNNLYEYIKTPLLATITCSLIEQGIDAPSNESEIYLARLHLLSDSYDTHKKIKRQNNRGDILIRFAKKLAFLMHVKKYRLISYEQAYNILRSEFDNKYTDAFIVSVINDLIDPCNLIIKDRYTSELSFGHFRFQEHLASLELSENRRINIIDYLDEDWWSGTLCLYAQKIGDIDILIDELITTGIFSKQSAKTLKLMANQLDKKTKNGLIELIEMYEGEDNYGFTLDLDNYHIYDY